MKALLALLLLAAAASTPAADSPKVFRDAFEIAETSFDPHRISDVYSNIVNQAMFEAPLTYDYLARPLKLKPHTLESLPEWRSCLDEGPAFEAARRLAQAVAAAAGLGLVAVDTVMSQQGPIVVDVTTNVSIAQFERTSGAALADAIIVLLETEARAKAIRIAAAQQ